MWGVTTYLQFLLLNSLFYYDFCALFLQVQKLETAELSFKLSLHSCNNISTGMQDELFVEMTILKPSVH